MIDAFNITRRGYPWWIYLLEGATALIVGILLLFVPRGTYSALFELLGFYWLVSGLLSIVGAFVSHAASGLKILSGVLAIIAGFIVIRHPLWSAVYVPLTLFLILGIVGVVYGLIQCVLFFTQGKQFLVLLRGFVSLFFALCLLLASPLLTVALPYLLALGGIVGGVLLMVLSLRLREEQIGTPQRASRVHAH